MMPTRDVTARNEATNRLLRQEQALRESEERLATLVEAIPDAVFLKDGEGRWLVVNAAAKELFALGDLPWRGKTELSLALLQPEMSGEHMACHASDEQAWANGRLMHSTEVIHRRGEGNRILDVSKVPLFDDEGGRRGLVVIARDVTEPTGQDAGG